MDELTKVIKENYLTALDELKGLDPTSDDFAGKLKEIESYNRQLTAMAKVEADDRHNYEMEEIEKEKHKLDNELMTKKADLEHEVSMKKVTIEESKATVDHMDKMRDQEFEAKKHESNIALEIEKLKADQERMEAENKAAAEKAAADRKASMIAAGISAGSVLGGAIFVSFADRIAVVSKNGLQMVTKLIPFGRK